MQREAVSGYGKLKEKGECTVAVVHANKVIMSTEPEPEDVDG